MRAYFGGKFPFAYKDFSKGELEKDYRAEIIGVDTLMRQPLTLPKIKENLEYAGPFYFYEEGATAEDIVCREAQTVANSDICYFLLDKDACQPGTVTEIINAAIHKKIIKIFYVCATMDPGEPERKISSPLWYPIIFAQKFNKENTIAKPHLLLKDARTALIKDVLN